MRTSHASLLVIIALSVLALSACSFSTRSPTHYPPLQSTTNTNKIIAGEEALGLYGINQTLAAPTSTVVSTSEPWFPMQVWVSAAVAPYADPAPIRYLSVYSDEDLGQGGTWLGYLGEGAEVSLWSVSIVGDSCFIEGVTVQGWPVKGWVLCNRLQFARPTRAPEEPGSE